MKEVSHVHVTKKRPKQFWCEECATDGAGLKGAMRLSYWAAAQELPAASGGKMQCHNCRAELVKAPDPSNLGDRRFRVLDPKDDSDCLGGEISYGNPYVCGYPAIMKGYKNAIDLEPGESSLAIYSLSGESGTYRIVRTK